MDFWMREEYGEAREAFHAEWKSYMQRSGVTHPGTITSLANTARAMLKNGETGALRTSYRAMRRALETFGPRHLLTVKLMCSHALILSEYARIDEAIILETHAVEQYSAQLGPSHPCTLAAVANLEASHAGRVQEKQVRLARTSACRM